MRANDEESLNISNFVQQTIFEVTKWMILSFRENM